MPDSPTGQDVGGTLVGVVVGGDVVGGTLVGVVVGGDVVGGTADPTVRLIALLDDAS